MENLKIAIIGGGNLGLSIAEGFIGSDIIQNKNVTVTKRNISPILGLTEHGVKVTRDNLEAVKNSDVILIVVKPYNVKNVLLEINPVLDPEKHIIVSLATGISIQEMEEYLDKDVSVFRAMPNIATDINESITCICNNAVTDEEKERVHWIFDQLGASVDITEDLMEAATILGACGIAYVLRFVRAMIQGGIQIGFDSETASKIVNQTVRGAADLMIARKEHPEQLIDKVTTPKGCTIVGLNEMEHQGFSSSLIKGIVTSFEKIEK
jgi:pyrroline-5-carboxylate reductase